ncbi:MAG: hypothetical protein NC307_13535 [Roseburia sp.]|nr:hypothetical protein [Roseburia sp.]
MQEIRTQRPNLFEPNDYITFYLELDGTVSANALADAIRAAYNANQSTVSKIVLTSEGTAFYEKMTKSGCKIEFLKDDWKNVIKTNEKIPFALEHGELIRSFILLGGNKTSLLIMAHHLAGDGKAMIYFIESIMTALSGAELEYRPLSMLSPETIPPSGRYTLVAKLYTKFCQRKYAKNPFAFSWKDYYRVHERYWKATSSCVLYKEFSKEDTDLIIESARQMGVSVNSYIVAAFLQTDSRNRVVGIPLSVRENENKSMANLTSGISITHSFDKNISFEGNAKQIQKKVSKMIKTYRWFVLRFLSEMPPSFIDGALLYTYHCCENPLMGQFAKIMGYIGDSNKRDLGITNLTVLDIPACYSTIRIKKIVFVPPNVSYSNNIIGVSTFQGEMTVTYHGTEENSGEQKDFFDSGVRNLLSNITIKIQK